MKSNLIYAAFAMIAFLFSAKAFPAQKHTPTDEFQKRFGSNNEYFNCTAKGSPVFAIFVNVPTGDAPTSVNEDDTRLIPRSEIKKLLSITAYKNRASVFDDNAELLFISWGRPNFDSSMKFMSIKLHNGETLVFERFRAIPGPEEVDGKPFFYLTISNGKKLSCG